MSSVEERLSEELAKLGKEAEQLVLEREAVQARVREIDTRLTQIAGAMVAINNVIGNQGEENE